MHASNGFDALDQLNKLAGQNITPCLIILDINMPGMDGREALIRIRQSGDYDKIPIVVFTTSSNQADQAFARKWGADFITKPLVYEELERLAKEFVDRCSIEIARRA